MTMTASSIASSSAVEHPRLAPLRGTGGLWVRLFAMLFRRQLGKVMTPVWVIYARMPHLLWPQVLMLRLAQRGLSLDPTLLDLVQIRVSMVNGCAFCTDLHRAVAMRSAREEKKLAALDDLAHGDALTAKERVALLFVDEVTRNGVAGDSTFAALRAAFDERQIVELVWLASFTGYLNQMAKALGIGSDGFCELTASKTA